MSAGIEPYLPRLLVDEALGQLKLLRAQLTDLRDQRHARIIDRTAQAIERALKPDERTQHLLHMAPAHPPSTEGIEE